MATGDSVALDFSGGSCLTRDAYGTCGRMTGCAAQRATIAGSRVRFPRLGEGVSDAQRADPRPRWECGRNTSAAKGRRAVSRLQTVGREGAAQTELHVLRVGLRVLRSAATTE